MPARIGFIEHLVVLRASVAYWCAVAVLHVCLAFGRQTKVFQEACKWQSAAARPGQRQAQTIELRTRYCLPSLLVRASCF